MNSSNIKKDPGITVVGAGWAGLAAAVMLSRNGYNVQLIEAAPRMGGRASSFMVDGKILDNGQHILLGAYRELLELLKILDINESDVFMRTHLKLKIHCLQDRGVQVTAGKLFSPLHMLSALLGARGLDLSEKWKIIRCWMSIRLLGFSIDEDIAVADFLMQQHQTERITKLFWAPLCIAALNTQIDKASAQVFLSVLKQSFTNSRYNSDMLLPKTSLDELLPAPAAQFIQQHGGTVRVGERLLKINIDGNSLRSIETSRGCYPATHMVLATPFHQTYKLLSPFADFAPITTAINCFDDEPITTLYMQFPEYIQLDEYILGLGDGITQWFIDRRTCGQPGLIAAVISANGKHMAMDKQSLTRAILDETGKIFPHWPRPVSTCLLREKRATFSCTTESGRLRPKPGNIGKNIWLAGDYLDTGLPATLEGAVSSGLQCARKIIHSHTNTL